MGRAACRCATGRTGTGSGLGRLPGRVSLPGAGRWPGCAHPFLPQLPLGGAPRRNDCPQPAGGGGGVTHPCPAPGRRAYRVGQRSLVTGGRGRGRRGGVLDAAVYLWRLFPAHFTSPGNGAKNIRSRALPRRPRTRHPPRSTGAPASPGPAQPPSATARTASFTGVSRPPAPACGRCAGLVEQRRQDGGHIVAGHLVPPGCSASRTRPVPGSSVRRPGRSMVQSSPARARTSVVRGTLRPQVGGEDRVGRLAGARGPRPWPRRRGSAVPRRPRPRPRRARRPAVDRVLAFDATARAPHPPRRRPRRRPPCAWRRPPPTPTPGRRRPVRLPPPAGRPPVPACGRCPRLRLRARRAAAPAAARSDHVHQR